MSAAVVALPTAAAAPVVQRARRGRLPGSVRSLVAFRSKRQQKHKEQVSANSAKLTNLCFRVLADIQKGEVTGLAIIEARGQERDVANASGAFADNLEHLQRALYAFADVASERLAKEGRS